MRRLILFIAVSTLWLSAAAGSASAEMPTTWKLDLHHRETNFPPGGTAEYWVDVTNIGGEDSAGPVAVTVDLPPGLTLASTRWTYDMTFVFWECGGTPGDTTVTCTTEQSIPKHTMTTGMVISVDVAPDAAGTLTTTATVEGGGAAEADSDSEATPIGSGLPGFGIVPGSYFGDFLERDEKTPERQAGSHPDLAVFAFDFNSMPYPNEALWPEVPYQKAPDENVRDLQINLPHGFLGDPTAVGECTAAQLTAGACPPSSQVGRIDLSLFPVQVNTLAQAWPGHYPVYNMVHPRGAVADLAFSIIGNAVHIKASLDPSDGYAIKTTLSDINETLPIFDQKLTLWGVPGEKSHGWERCTTEGALEYENPTEPCETGQSPKAFLTLPAQCEVDHSIKLSRYDSWTDRGDFGPELKTDPFQVDGCEKPRFEPEVRVQPTGTEANTPTGLDVHVEVPQNENPYGLATPTVKRFEVTLPEGMSFSPSFADGLTGCTQDQIGLGTDDAVACPNSSRVGSLELTTPLLPEPLRGSMYLSTQGGNPFGATYGVYLVAHDEEERGVLIKLPGRLDLDPDTGQITVVFDELPQLPFDDLTLGFRSGPRAPLVNPPSCGTQTIGVAVTSWAQPDEPVDLSNTYEVSRGPEGTPCPSGERRFGPAMEAGTLNPVAGAFSPFLFRFSRGDADQELSRVETTLPPGLLARIAEVSECPEAALASISGAEGTAQAEADHPACPASSQIGTVSAGMGAGTGPNYFPGRVYLAGPYKGAPLSLGVVVPALAGPYDLGSVVVRAAIHVDPETAQVRVVSDPLPTILHGVLLRVRDVRVRMDRAETMVNPTNCSPNSVEGLFTSIAGSQSLLASRFQVGDCASLGFAPKLALKLKGATHRGDFPALTATLRARSGDANIGRAAVTLPHSEFLEQAHIRTVCTRVQYAAKECPAGSVYGFAEASSPLLAEPLRGPVYLRSSDNPLPDLVASLDGRVHLDLVGRIDSVNGGIRTTFPQVPDAPVTRFTLRMKGGKKSLLVNSRNLCKGLNRAAIKLGAHNGRRLVADPKVAVPCRKKRGR